MKQSAAILAATLVAFVAAEVPQELSHGMFLTNTQTALQLNNRFNIVDPVFGLLGAAAAADGAGDVTDLDCLQQIIADEAFTNALTIEDENQRINSLANALIYRTLEKNTGSVGLASVNCGQVANNPEIAALSQHQDPASEGAQQLNKDIALSLAVQLASVGADPTLALLSGTFVPGDVNDNTGAGNTCDTPLDQDPVGCIFTLNRIVADATIDEINQAVSDAMGAGAPQANAAMASDLSTLASMMASGQISAAAADNGNAQASASASASGNLQAFSGNLGGPAPAIEDTGDANRPFQTNGATFQNLSAAIQRSCAVQNNACANAANSGQIDASVGDCNAQENECRASANLKMKRVVKARQNGALDFGSCSDPSIQFADGLDGRREASFAPNNKGDFSQGSALNINIISSFICGRLQDSCKADESTVAACETGRAAAQGQQGQAAADAFNAALGL